MASTNVTSNTLTKWKKKVDASLVSTTDTKSIVKDLTNIKKCAKALKDLTKAGSSADKDNLSYRFGHLETLCSDTLTELKGGMTKFDKVLASFIKSHQSAEASLKDKQLASVDQFKEAATKIKALKWS